MTRRDHEAFECADAAFARPQDVEHITAALVGGPLDRVRLPVTTCPVHGLPELLLVQAHELNRPISVEHAYQLRALRSLFGPVYVVLSHDTALYDYRPDLRTDDHE